MQIERFGAGPLDNNVYVVADEASGQAAVIDPGMESEAILGIIRDRGWRVVQVINTHGHFDHVFADAYFVAQTGAPLLIHGDDVPSLEQMPAQASWFGFPPSQAPAVGRELHDGDTISFGAVTLQVIHTPGHTPGGICLLAGDVLFSGDTLFAGSIGRTDLPGGDHALLVRSIREKLFVLPDDTRVLPGHGPETTIGNERAHNPWV